MCLETLVREMNQGDKKKKWGDTVWWLLLWGSWLHIVAFPSPKTFEDGVCTGRWNWTSELKGFQKIAAHAAKV